MAGSNKMVPSDSQEFEQEQAEETKNSEFIPDNSATSVASCLDSSSTSWLRPNERPLTHVFSKGLAQPGEDARFVFSHGFGGKSKFGSYFHCALAVDRG